MDGSALRFLGALQSFNRNVRGSLKRNLSEAFFEPHCRWLKTGIDRLDGFIIDRTDSKTTSRCHLEVQMKARFFAVILGLALLLPSLSSGALAHHSTSYYKLETMTITGTVVQFRFRNPHAVVVWDSKDEATGEVVRWTGELSSVTTLMGDGLTRNSLKPGDEIIFTLRQTKQETPQGAIRTMARPDGTYVLRYSTQSETGLTDEERQRAREENGIIRSRR